MDTNEKMKEAISPDLKLNFIAYDELFFRRLGLEETDKEFEITQFDLQTYKLTDLNIYSERFIRLIFKGIKQGEYKVAVTITGYFTILKNEESLKDNEIKDLSNRLEKCAANILLPYLRQQVTHLTTQPYMKPLVLPIYNINNFVSKINIKDMDNTEEK